MNEMNITSAQYYTGETGDVAGIVATISGVEMLVPLQEGNLEYDEIMRQVNEGTLTIAEAEE
jgi:hypothetical protein